MRKNELICRTEIEVKFSEVDSMGVVWHGNYIRYFEDGREAFGKKYHISYLDFHRMGVAIPLVKINCDYKKPLKYGDTAVIETRFVDSDAAKLRYDYTISNKENSDIVATGSSTQVFLNSDMELLLDFPAFFVAWKKEMGIM